jgi:hypothetical protein
MKHRSLVTFGLAILVLPSCKNETPDKLKLRDDVWLYCNDLSSDLHRGAETYAELAPHLDGGQMSPDQVARADQRLTFSAIGVSELVQLGRMLDVEARLRFCASVRKVELKQTSDTVVRFVQLSETLNNAKTHVEKAKVLDELAKIARQVNELQIRD